MASVSKRQWTYKGTTKETWMVRYFDQKGIQRGKSFDKKKDADAFKRKVEAELDQGVHTADRDTVTIAEAVRQFARHTEHRHKDGRIGRSRAYVLVRNTEHHVGSKIGAIKVKDLRPDRVEELYREFVDRDGVSPRAAKLRLYDFRLVEDFCVDRGYTNARPVAAGLKRLSGMTTPRVRTFMSEEIAHLLSVVDRRQPVQKARSHAMMRCVVHLATFCGMRFGEISALDLAHLDLNARLIHVRQNVTQWGEMKGPKSAAGNRDLPIPIHVVVMLRDWLSTHYVDSPERRGF